MVSSPSLNTICSERPASHSPIVMPAKTPAPYVKRMHAEFAKILRLPEVKERIQAQGLEVVGSTPEALAQLMIKDAAKYKSIIQEIGLKPQ